MQNASREPAAYAEAVRLAVAALVGLGWVTLNDTTISTIVSAVGALASIVLTVLVRAHVAPVADQPLTPASSDEEPVDPF